MTESKSLETSSSVAPEFDTGIFTIEYLSKDPSGFQVRTVNSLLRHQPNTPLPEAKKIRTERDKEERKFRVGQKFHPKVGLRNIQLEGNVLNVDIVPVTFPTYRAMGTQEDSPEVYSISNPSATSMILLTTETDGSHRILVQNRHVENFFYGGIPGASVAGYLDGHMDPKNRGKLLPLSVEAIRANVEQEMSHEIGLRTNELTAFKLTGLSKDRRRIHDELLFLGEANLSYGELWERIGHGDDFDLAEKFVAIDATPEAIQTLLTEVRCPLPPTHAAAFVAAGYSLMVERDGINKAEAWKNDMERLIKDNYRQIDEVVRNFYKENPSMIDQRDNKKPPRKINGYDPAYLPERQGLPSMMSEMKRTGLIA